jgi:hypothetical protein
MTISVASILVLASLSAAQQPGARCSTGHQAAAELRAAHEIQRRAHLEGNADLLAAGTADEMVLVSNGNLSVNQEEKVIGFFRGYFTRVKYLEWSDVGQSVVNISPDGQMGWMAVKVRARYVERAKPEAGEKAFNSSWIATYQRVGCEWKMTGNASAVVDE